MMNLKIKIKYTNHEDIITIQRILKYLKLNYNIKYLKSTNNIITVIKSPHVYKKFRDQYNRKTLKLIINLGYFSHNDLIIHNLAELFQFFHIKSIISASSSL